MGMYVGVVSGEVCSVWRCGQWGGVVNVGGGGGKGGYVDTNTSAGVKGDKWKVYI